MNRIVLLFSVILLSSLIQFGNTKSFTDSSYLILLSDGSANLIYERDLTGVDYLQFVIIPFGLYSSKQISLDVTGSFLVLPSIKSSQDMVYTYNALGTLVDTTAVTSGSGIQYGMVSSQDVWMGSSTKVSYTARGTTSANPIASNIIPGSGFTLGPMQIVGTTLYYVKTGTGLMVMDPIVKTGTGTEALVLDTVDLFYICNKTHLYIVKSTNQLWKYSLSQNGVATYQNYQATASMTIQSVTAVETNGVIYVLISGLGVDGSTYKVVRYTDTGASFLDENLRVSSTSQDYISIVASPKQTCYDGVQDQDETDVDCGGSKCSGCAAGKTCLANSDSASKICPLSAPPKVCAAPACDDTVMNGDETDVDCGGSCGTKCAESKSCLIDGDCLSKNCLNNVCEMSCFDGFKNQNETDIDCGGVCGATCVNSASCLRDSDCSGAYCNPNAVCSDPTCSDVWKNQDETDVDCGGALCAQCVDGKACMVNGDCSSNYCNPESTCSSPSCSDGWLNQNEADIDCGGSCLNKCVNGKKCTIDADCQSGSCNTVCVDPPVAPVSPPQATPITAPEANSEPISSTPSTSSTPAGSTTPKGRLIVSSASGFNWDLMAFSFIGIFCFL